MSLEPAIYHSLVDNKPQPRFAEITTIEVTPDDLVTYPKVHRLYRVRIVLPARNSEGAWLPHEEEFYFKQRYSILFKANSLVLQHIQILFPPKHAFEDFSRDKKNVEQRAKDLDKYFNAALRDISSLSNKVWHKAIGVTEQQSIYLMDIAHEMNRKGMYHKPGGVALMEELHLHSQFFHLHYPFTMSAAVLSFAISMQFVVTTSRIMTPDKNTWFLLSRDNTILSSRVIISNCIGEQLMSVIPSLGSCDIVRISRGVTVECCKFDYYNDFISGMVFGLVKKGSLCPEFLRVTGGMGGMDILERSGTAVRMVRQGTFDQEVIVNLPPNADVMLYLAVAVALELMCRGRKGRRGYY